MTNCEKCGDSPELLCWPFSYPPDTIDFLLVSVVQETPTFEHWVPSPLEFIFFFCSQSKWGAPLYWVNRVRPSQFEKCLLPEFLIKRPAFIINSH